MPLFHVKPGNQVSQLPLNVHHFRDEAELRDFFATNLEDLLAMSKAQVSSRSDAPPKTEIGVLSTTLRGAGDFAIGRRHKMELLNWFIDEIGHGVAW